MARLDLQHARLGQLSPIALRQQVGRQLMLSQPLGLGRVLRWQVITAVAAKTRLNLVRQVIDVIASGSGCRLECEFSELAVDIDQGHILDRLFCRRIDHDDLLLLRVVITSSPGDVHAHGIRGPLHLQAGSMVTQRIRPVPESIFRLRADPYSRWRFFGREGRCADMGRAKAMSPTSDSVNVLGCRCANMIVSPAERGPDIDSGLMPRRGYPHHGGEITIARRAARGVWQDSAIENEFLWRACRISPEDRRP